MSAPVREAEARGRRPQGAEEVAVARDVAHRVIQHAMGLKEGLGTHGNGAEPWVTAKGEHAGEIGTELGGQLARVAVKGQQEAAPAGTADVRQPPPPQQQQRQHPEIRAQPSIEDRPSRTPGAQLHAQPPGLAGPSGKISERPTDNGAGAGSQGRGVAAGVGAAGKMAADTGAKAAEGTAKTTIGAVRDVAGAGGGVDKAAGRGAAGAAGVTREDAAAAAKGGGAAAARGAELAERVGQGAAGAATAVAKPAAGAAEAAAKGTAVEAAKGLTGAAHTTRDAAGAAAKVPAEVVGEAAKMAAQGAGKIAAAAKAAPSAAVSGAKGAVDVSRSAVETAASGARSAVQTGRGAARTGAWAVSASADAAQRGAAGMAQALQTLLHWWYLLVFQLPYRAAAGGLHMGWVVGHAGLSAAGRGAVWFMDTATWAGELAYKWLLDGIIRVNRGMDAAISATPPLVKGQLARAAVVSAPEGPNLVDSLSNKSPAQIGGIFRGLTAAAAAAKQEPLIAGGEDKAAGERGKDLVEQVNAALHAAFDRPDVLLEAPDHERKRQQQQQQQQQPKPGSEALRSVDVLHDRLVDQARLLVWHLWMVGRLQLTAAAEVAAVTRGMWSWLLRCVTHLAAALGLLAAMSVAAAGGAVVAACAWVCASAVRQLRTAATLEVRARRVWAPLALRALDAASVLARPLLRAPPLPPTVAAAAAKEPQQPQQPEAGKEAGREEPAKEPKGAVAAAMTALSPLWEAVCGGQAYVRDSLASGRQRVQELVPRDPEREEAEAARAVESFAGLSAVLRSSDFAFAATWRLAQASAAALSDLSGNLIADVARRYHIPVPKFAWFKGKAAQVAQDTAISGFARVAGTGPASVVAGMVGAPMPTARQAPEQQTAPSGGGSKRGEDSTGGAAQAQAPVQEMQEGGAKEPQRQVTAATGEGKPAAEGAERAGGQKEAQPTRGEK